MPDKSVDAVITDPPYGIGADSSKFINGTSKTDKPYYRMSNFDTCIPTKEYFDEMIRVSRFQIIWGGNYFTEYLKNTRCFLVWDKTIHGNSYADCEMAWTSYDKVARIIPINMVSTNLDGRVHPTQKPELLMR
jgi:site-specific DNA-methyltransferase (adenine-specific)